MTLDLMRQLEAQHKRLWDDLVPPGPESEAARDCDPALLSGWTDRDISLWDVGASDGKPGLQEILIALCRQKRKDWEKISYLRFPKEAVSSSSLELTSCNAKTGDNWVDTSKTHFEIRGITGKGLCTLLFEVSRRNFETGSFSKAEFEKIMNESYDRMAKHSRTARSDAQTSPTPLPVASPGEQRSTSILAPDRRSRTSESSEERQKPPSSTS